ncbi:MAG: cytochrome c oxidase subunit 2 [Bradymonadia bacterium]|jgi:cytochrome c oxidase subunit 2
MANPAESGSFWMPPQASTVAADVDSLFDFVMLLNYIFFALILFGTVFLVLKYRRKSDNQVAKSQIAHNVKIEALWTFGPLVILIFVFVWGFRVFLDQSVAPAGAYEVQVTAKKWNWSFRHPNGAQEFSELTVPLGRPVKLVMRSEDVLHSFFVPSFRVKQDVVPGRYTTLWFEATKAGDHQVMCTEYCGKDHSSMLAMVKVVDMPDPEGYDGPNVGKPDDMPSAVYGAGLYKSVGCSACHSLDGSKGTGPSFKGLYGRMEELSDGSKIKVDENYLVESIHDPKAKSYGPVMPSYKGQVEGDKLDGIIAFIKAQK